MAKPEQTARKIGDFELLSELGRGGMGVVYKARDTKLQRLVALKFLPASLKRQGTQAVERFLREARTAAQLIHPNVVAVLSISEYKDLRFIVMEYVEGTSLDELLAKWKKLTWEEATRLIMQAARGLAAAHAKGIIHRDIKPSNIMVTDDGTVKVADFGLARRTEESLKISHSGQVVGTPLYMSPGQCEGKELDHRSDIYSLGATYYYLLTNRHPFEGGSALEVMRKHVEAPLTPPREYEPEIPDGVCSIIARMMAKRPEQRYESAEELLSDLEKAQSGVTLDARKATAPEEGVTPPTGEEPVIEAATPQAEVEEREAEKTPSWQLWLRQRKTKEKRNLILINAICLVALIAMVIGGFMIFGKGKKDGRRGGHARRALSPTGRKSSVAAKGSHGQNRAPRGRSALLKPSQDKKLYEEALAFEKANPQDYEGILGRYEAAANAADAMTDSKWAAKAKEKVAEYEQKKIERYYNQVRAEAEKLKSEDKFGAAIAKYEAFSKDHILTQWSDKAKSDIRETEKAAEAKFEESDSRAKEHIKKGELAKAKAIYDAVVANYGGIDAIVTEAKKGLAAIRTLEEEEAKLQAARKKVEAEDRYRELTEPVEELAKNGGMRRRWKRRS